MYFTTVVKVVLDGPEERPMPGVQVRLYDRDLFSSDDLLGEQVTDQNGEARFQYTSDSFVDLDDRLGGSMPDLYAVVNGANGEQLATTKAETIDNTPQKHLTVRVPGGAGIGSAPAATDV